MRRLLLVVVLCSGCRAVSTAGAVDRAQQIVCEVRRRDAEVLRAAGPMTPPPNGWATWWSYHCLTRFMCSLPR
jgi:hypothetical protein